MTYSTLNVCHRNKFRNSNKFVYVIEVHSVNNNKVKLSVSSKSAQ